MTKFPSLLNTLEGLANKYAHKKTFLHKEEIIKGHMIALQPFPQMGIYTPSQAIIFLEKDTVAVFFTEDEDFIQIHDEKRQFVSFMNPCLLKIRHQNTEKERISIQMHLFQLLLHTALVQNMINGQEYEASLEELKHLFSNETLVAYRKVQDWIHRYDNNEQLFLAA